VYLITSWCGDILKVEGGITRRWRKLKWINFKFRWDKSQRKRWTRHTRLEKKSYKMRVGKCEGKGTIVESKLKLIWQMNCCTCWSGCDTWPFVWEEGGWGNILELSDRFEGKLRNDQLQEGDGNTSVRKAYKILPNYTASRPRSQ